MDNRKLLKYEQRHLPDGQCLLRDMLYIILTVASYRRLRFKCQLSERLNERVFLAVFTALTSKKIRTADPVLLLNSTLLGCKSPAPPLAIKVPGEGRASTFMAKASLLNRKLISFNTSFCPCLTLITICCSRMLFLGPTAIEAFPPTIPLS